MESWHSTALDFHLLTAVYSKARYILRQDTYTHMICGLYEVLTFPQKNQYYLLAYWFLMAKYTTSLVDYALSCSSLQEYKSLFSKPDVNKFQISHVITSSHACFKANTSKMRWFLFQNSAITNN